MSAAGGDERAVGVPGVALVLTGAGIATAYFDWLAWTLVVAVVGVAANLPVAVAHRLRVVGFLLGVIGAGLGPRRKGVTE